MPSEARVPVQTGGSLRGRFMDSPGIIDTELQAPKRATSVFIRWETPSHPLPLYDEHKPSSPVPHHLCCLLTRAPSTSPSRWQTTKLLLQSLWQVRNILKVDGFCSCLS